MVALDIVKQSNSTITNSLPPNPVAIFVGGTSGIGLYTLQAFTRYASNPRAYIIGRSQSAADRIIPELKATNPSGTYTFIQSDTSLIKNVDSVCEQIASKEKYINILFLTTGTLVIGQDTSEGLSIASSLVLHSRTRFTINLLPLLQNATGLKRVVSVMAATKEGPIPPNVDFQARNTPLLKIRAQGASMLTMSMAEMARRAPDVSFIHDFPGPVKTGIGRGMNGFAMRLMGAVFAVVGPLIFIPNEECGERHLYLATSARYPATKEGNDGVEVTKGDAVAKGIDGKVGSGIYSIDEKCESGGQKVVDVLTKVREEGWREKVWGHVRGEFVRITGKESM